MKVKPLHINTVLRKRNPIIYTASDGTTRQISGMHLGGAVLDFVVNGNSEIPCNLLYSKLSRKETVQAITNYFKNSSKEVMERGENLSGLYKLSRNTKCLTARSDKIAKLGTDWQEKWHTLVTQVNNDMREFVKPFAAEKNFVTPSQVLHDLRSKAGSVSEIEKHKRYDELYNNYVDDIANRVIKNLTAK